jgi:TorA maturation chaperone TorD
MCSAAIEPPKDHREGIMLMASGLCSRAERKSVEDFREHYRTCKWCQAYVRQVLDDSHYAISEVGWWNGYGDRDIA